MKKVLVMITLMVMVCLCCLTAQADDLQAFAIQTVQVNEDGGINVGIFDPQKGQLQGKDFNMLIDQSPVAVESVSSLKSADVETTWLFVVDLSILGTRRLTKTQAILNGIVSGDGTAIGPKDKAGIFTTGMSAKDIQLTNDRRVLQEQIKELKLDAKSNQFYAQVATALNYLETSNDVQDRHVLVLISSGVNDTVTGMTYEELSRNLQNTKTTVYTFALLEKLDQKKQENYNALARSSVGGQFFEIPQNINTVDDQVEELLRNENQFRCLSANPGKQGIKGKTVSVSRTDNPKVSDHAELTKEQQILLSNIADAANEAAVTTEPTTEATTEPPEEPTTGVTIGPVTLSTVQIGIIAGAIIIVILVIVLLVKKSKKKAQTTPDTPSEPSRYEEPAEKTEVASQKASVSTLMVKLESVGLDDAKTYSSPMVDELIIGRAPSKARLIVPDPKVSGANSKLTYENHVMFIEDLGSTNGTHLNGMKVSGRVVVHQQDTIRIGQSNLRISWEKVK